MLNLWARPNGKCNNHSIILWEWDWIVADLISVEFFCSASLFSAGLWLELKRAVETCWEINLYSWLFCGLLAHLTHNAMLSWIPSLYASILHSHLVNHVPFISRQPTAKLSYPQLAWTLPQTPILLQYSCVYADQRLRFRFFTLNYN